MLSLTLFGSRLSIVLSLVVVIFILIGTPTLDVNALPATDESSFDDGSISQQAPGQSSVRTVVANVLGTFNDVLDVIRYRASEAIRPNVNRRRLYGNRFYSDYDTIGTDVQTFNRFNRFNGVNGFGGFNRFNRFNRFNNRFNNRFEGDLV